MTFTVASSGAGGVGFADPVNALIGDDLHVDPVAAAGTDEECFDVGDLHRAGVADLAAVERLKATTGVTAHHAATSTAAAALLGFLCNGLPRHGG
jgi:hypothetical protein